MSRILGLVYGFVCYAVGFGSLAYAALFLNNVVGPWTIDGGTAGSLGLALAVNSLLAGLFAVQHSVMARQGFKRVWTRRVPQFAERSTYVLFSGLALVLLYVFWQPMPQIVWSIETPAVRIALLALHVFGWLFLVAATFMLSHGELFGLTQVVAHARGQAPAKPTFRAPGFYRYVRHPIQVGVLIVFWTAPDMSLGHLVLSLAITGYILVALTCFEERDLVREFGTEYTTYREQVGMLVPRSPRTFEPAA